MWFLITPVSALRDLLLPRGRLRPGEGKWHFQSLKGPERKPGLELSGLVYPVQVALTPAVPVRSLSHLPGRAQGRTGSTLGLQGLLGPFCGHVQTVPGVGALWLSHLYHGPSLLLFPGWRAAVPRGQCQEEDPSGQASWGWTVGGDAGSRAAHRLP